MAATFGGKLVLGWLVCACACLPLSNGNEQDDIVQMIREGATVYDTRDELMIEVYGYLENSTLVNEFTFNDDVGKNLTEGQPDANTIYIVNNTQVEEEICGAALCYTGSLDIFEDFLVYPQNVTFEGLHIMIPEKRIQLIDIRNTTEVGITGTLPSAYNVDLVDIPNDFQLSPEEYMAKYNHPLPGKEDRNIVLSCRIGVSVYWAKARMEKIGYKYIRVYNGSFKEWKARGGELVFLENEKY